MGSEEEVELRWRKLDRKPMDQMRRRMVTAKAESLAKVNRLAAIGVEFREIYVIFRVGTCEIGGE